MCAVLLKLFVDCIILSPALVFAPNSLNWERSPRSQVNAIDPWHLVTPLHFPSSQNKTSIDDYFLHYGLLVFGSFFAVAALEEQQEKLRRVVDAWRWRSNDLLKNLCGDDPYGSLSPLDLGSSNSDPVHVWAEPFEHSDVPTLVQSDNVSVAKLISVLSYDCIEISRLSRHVRFSFFFPQFPPFLNFPHAHASVLFL